MKVNVLLLFPKVFAALDHSISGKALADKSLELNLVDIRDFATDRYKSVDDAPYGGGAGQVMRADIVAAAIDSLRLAERGAEKEIYYLSPRGARFTQKTAEKWSRAEEITLICGHYEGLDERVLEEYAVKEISLGDFVLSSGELAALAMLDAAARLVPGVLGNPESGREESFGASLDGLLEYPQFTRPEEWRGRKVPSVLLSGHHAEIAAWRKAKSREITRARRPDLAAKE